MQIAYTFARQQCGVHASTQLCDLLSPDISETYTSVKSEKLGLKRLQ